MLSNPKYARMDGEGQYEYGLRLIGQKIEENPDDLDWQDIVEATGLKCHRDSLRKAASNTPYCGYEVMRYFKRLQSAGKAERPDDYIRELDCKIVQAQKEQKKFFDQRREFNKMVLKMGRRENLEDRLYEAALGLNEHYPLVMRTVPNGKHGDSEAVIVFADWHYGMVADNIWGHYDTGVCRERVSRLVDMAGERLRLHDCRKLHVVLLGDMCHGAIHVSARVASEELVCDQIMQVSEIIAQAISRLADQVLEVDVHATYGNHMRTVQNKADNLHADNMEKLIPWWLRWRLHGRDDVKFSNDSFYEFLYFDVCGFHVCASHGDLDSLRSAGRTMSTLFMKRFGTGVDYVILADKHHKEEFEDLGIESMIVPCLCGTDEYANGKRLYSTPGQTMMVFRPGIGADACYQIKFGRGEVVGRERDE